LGELFPALDDDRPDVELRAALRPPHVRASRVRGARDQHGERGSDDDDGARRARRARGGAGAAARRRAHAAPFNMPRVGWRSPHPAWRAGIFRFSRAGRCVYDAPRMTAEERRVKAVDLVREAYHRQMAGDLEGAIDHYQRSIEIFPTAEAHTFLGWTYSFQRR